ncbi:MAG: hypothetical protein ACM359_23550 [Bacillota bacterium]
MNLEGKHTAIHFLTINDKLAGKDGGLFDGMMQDELHPTLKEYQLWPGALKPIFTELLGPQSATTMRHRRRGTPAGNRIEKRVESRK